MTTIINKKINFGITIIVMSLAIYSCGNKKTSGEEEIHEEHSVGSVELTDAQFKAAQIELGSFESKNLSEVITANGYTKLPPQNQADVSVFIGGIVKSISVIEGQPVKAGQSLATLESLEFTKMQEDYLSSKSHLEYLQLDFDRQKTLSEENVSSKKTFQKIKSDLAVEQARYNSLKKQLEVLKINPDKAITSVIHVTAPISGYITRINIKIGSSPAPNTPLFSIVDNTKMHVDLLIYEKDLFKVKEGQKVRFVLTNQSNKEIMGRIFSIGQAFQNETKSVAVHADIDNSKSGLIPGMYVNALIDIGNNNVNTLPVEAIVKAEGKEFIFIVAEEGKHDEAEKHEHKAGDVEEHKESGKHFIRIEVKTGTVQLGFVQVTPLQEIAVDTKIVTKGAYYLQSTIANAEGGDDHGH